MLVKYVGLWNLQWRQYEIETRPTKSCSYNTLFDSDNSSGNWTCVVRLVMMSEMQLWFKWLWRDSGRLWRWVALEHIKERQRRQFDAGWTLFRWQGLLLHRHIRPDNYFRCELSFRFLFKLQLLGCLEIGISKVLHYDKRSKHNDQEWWMFIKAGIISGLPTGWNSLKTLCFNSSFVFA